MLLTMNLACIRRIEKVMKRNFDLVRAILLQVEHEGDPEEPLITAIAVDGHDQPADRATRHPVLCNAGC